MSAIVNSATIAEQLNLTPRRIEQLVQEGMPRLARGKYDLWPCAQWYIRYLQLALERRATDPDSSTNRNLTEEKKRLIRAQADMAEVELLRKTGELIPAHLVDDKFITFAGNIHDRMLSLPSRIAPRLEGLTRDSIRVKLHEAVRDTLNSLSEHLQGKLPGSKSDDDKSKKSDKKRKPRRPPFTSAATRSKKTRRRS